MSPATDKHVLDLLAAVTRLNLELASGVGGSYPPPYAAVLALFDRCCGILGAITLLLDHDFVHEAIILARPLFTDSLALSEISAADEHGRKEFAVRLHLTGITHAENLFRLAQSRGDDFEQELANLAEERKAVEGYARREDLSTSHWQPDDHAKDLAKKHRRSGEYLDMRLTDHFVHGSARATQQRYEQLADGKILVGADSVELATWANPTGLFVVHSGLCVARATSRTFGVSEPLEVETLADELRAAMSARRTRSGGETPQQPDAHPRG